MPDSSSALPFPYYLCWIAVVFMGWNAWKNREKAWGIPMLVVIATSCAWYLLDPLYNGYEGYVSTFGPDILSAAWWEVLLFLISFMLLVPTMNQKINGNLPELTSQIFQSMRSGRIDSDEFQDQVEKLSRSLLIGWCSLMAVAIWRLNFDIGVLFFPYIVGDLTSPWRRDRVGGGIDSIFAFAIYIQTMFTALWGVVLALAKRPMVMTTAAIVYFLAEPFYLFDRTRNTMLATLVPGLLALVTLRMKGGMIKRLAVLAAAFAMLNFWFLFVLEIRGVGGSISEAFKSGAFSNAQQVETEHKKKHEGFNMFEELCYINYFTDNGTYKPNWGARYFAEIVNPIPRVLWPGKPMIGIDYAIARGMAYGNVDEKSGGVAASFSTGMIGQGVVNFGRILGPIASAFLMAIWVAVLARQDLMGRDLGHLLLYAIGLVLTFNMGRDITLLVIYPFVFGWLLLSWLNRKKSQIITPPIDLKPVQMKKGY